MTSSLYECFSADSLHSKELYESIPEQHRPRLETNGALNKVALTVSGGSQKPLGSTIMPIILTDATTGQKFCIKLHALVMESLLMDIFIVGGWHRLHQKYVLGSRSRDFVLWLSCMQDLNDSVMQKSQTSSNHGTWNECLTWWRGSLPSAYDVGTST